MARRKAAVAAGLPDGARVIRRYANRKLYDVQSGQYVDLAGLARQIGRGAEIHVVDQRTGHDITSQVLAQILLDGLRDRTAAIPQQVLLRLVRASYAPRPDWAEWLDPHRAAARARSEAERVRHEVALSLSRVVDLVSRGVLTGPPESPAKAPRPPARKRPAARKER